MSGLTGRELLKDAAVQAAAVEALRNPRSKQTAGAIEGEDFFVAAEAGDGQRVVLDRDAVRLGAHDGAIVT
jgi:hypothetical protein